MAFFQVDREAAASVIYSIAISSPITPTEPLPPLPSIPRGSLVIVEGRAPIWRYGMALHLASTARLLPSTTHASPSPKRMNLLK